MALSTHGGYQALSIEGLCSRAGVSTQSFYEHFSSKEDCFLEAYRRCAQRILAHTVALAPDAGDWRQAARRALGALLQNVASDPDAGRLIFIEALGAGPLIAAERELLLGELQRTSGALLAPTPAQPQTLDVPSTALLGALRHIVSRHLRTDAEDQLPALLKDGLAWLSSYARPPGTAPWSTSPAALDLAHAPPPWAPWAPQTLPHGTHGLSASAIAQSQRTRLIAATAQVTLAKGFAGARVADIGAAARVSQGTFYEYFTDKQDAFLEAQQHAAHCILERSAEAYFSADRWPARVWRCLESLLGLTVEHPAAARLCLIECYAAGPVAIRRSEALARSFTFFLAEGYRYRPQNRSLPRLYSQAITGAIFEILARLIHADDFAAVGAHLPQLTYVALAPFTGASQAVALVEAMKRADGA